MIWTQKYFGTFDHLRIALLFGRNYAELLWQSGALGHVLYLAAEAAGFGATGHWDGIKGDGAVNVRLRWEETCKGSVQIVVCFEFFLQ